MKKIILIPAIILLVCCVTVGAFNVVSNSNNRPMTFYESLVAFSEIDFSFDEMANLLEKISRMWSADDSSYAGPGGSPGNTGGGGTIVENGGYSNQFGSPNYKADTGLKWLDNVLNFCSNFIATVNIFIQLLVLLVRDAITTVYTLFDIITRFVVGVPKTPA